MAGIVSYGAYIPKYRLSRDLIAKALGSPPMEGEKAIANYDEDSLTMAVATGMDCLQGTERAAINGMYFATTTSPYQEGESAAIIATALDLHPNIRTADFANSLKAGTAALLSACDSIKAGEVGNMLVCAADCRLGKHGSNQEMLFGDGAAGLLLGSNGVVASLEGSYSASYDFPDYRRTEDKKFVQATEDRFIREEGYAKFIPEAISGLLKKHKLEAKDFAKVAYSCPYPREHAALGKRLGLEPAQIQQPLLAKAGELGAASPLMLLIAMLEEAKPHDNILLCSYGNGAQALFFKVTEEIERVRNRRGVSKYLASKIELTRYDRYLAFRGILPVEAGGEEVAITRLPLTWRERKAILALYGSKCKRCGTPQYPPQRICVNPDCGATNEMEDYRFSDKKGTVFSYTKDYISASLNPPLVYGMIDFEGGGRFLFDLTDCEPDKVKVGMPVEMSFRKKYFDRLRGIHGYFWKAIPVRE